MLLADDDAHHTSALELDLWRRGYRVVTAPGAEQALALLDSEEIDAVLTDLGLEFAQRVAARHPDVPLIVLTTSGEAEAPAAIRAGAYDFLSKPATLEAIFLSLGRALQQRHLRREVAQLRVAASSGEARELVTLEEMEKRYVLRVLESHGGNKTAAARTLGIERKTLYRKLESWGVKDVELAAQR